MPIIRVTTPENTLTAEQKAQLAPLLVDAVMVEDAPGSPADPHGWDLDRFTADCRDQRLSSKTSTRVADGQVPPRTQFLSYTDRNCALNSFGAGFLYLLMPIGHCVDVVILSAMRRFRPKTALLQAQSLCFPAANDGGCGISLHRFDCRASRSASRRSTEPSRSATAGRQSQLGVSEVRDNAAVIDICLSENERRFAGYDPRLLRPRLMPRLMRFARRFMR